MSTGEAFHPGNRRALSPAERYVFVGLSVFGLTVVALLVAMYLRHTALWDASGHPVPLDFIAYWAAGDLTLHVSPLAPYDRHLEHAAEVAIVGHGFPDYLQWAYPPLFLFVAVALASIPLAPAFAVWEIATTVLQGVAAAGIARSRSAFFVSWAAPWTLIGMIHGQNQSLTAALVGFVLIALETQPALSGIVLGLLSYKPQLAILFPVALAFGGYWRALAWACASTILWTALSCSVFGVDALFAFLRGISHGAEGYIQANGIPWSQVQSLYGVARRLGATPVQSGALQGVLIVICGVGIARLWRSRAPFALKAGGLAATIPLVTPYIFIYDYAVLSVAIACLFRQRPFDRVEYLAIGSAMLCTVFYIWTEIPAGLVAAAVVTLLVVRRLCFASHREKETEEWA